MAQVLVSTAPPAARAAPAKRTRRLRHHGQPDWRDDRLAGAPAPDRDRRHAGQLRRHRLGRPASRSCSCTASAASGRTGSRTSRALAQERRVIALDLPGFGLTPMPRDQITISGYGRCVNALCEKLGPRPGRHVGNSMGGFVAAEVAIQFPERVDQLVLVSAAGDRERRRREDAGHHRRARDAGVAHRTVRARCDRSIAAPADARATRARARGPPPEPAQGRPRLRGLLQGRRQARLPGRAARQPQLRLPRPPARDPPARR